MQKILLDDYVSKHTHQATADLIGCHQTNIGLMLKKRDRKFILNFDDDGQYLYTVEEKVAWPKGQAV